MGRFAPSPTGPLHLGSLVSALVSCLEARRLGGRWLVRMEDLDPPREVAGAADDILRTLEAFGFRWDGSVLYQSSRAEAYAEALDALRERGAAFPCACTRREVAAAGLQGLEGPVYPGTCRDGLPAGRGRRSLRFRVPAGRVCFPDAFQGEVCQDVAAEIGDFVLRRADGLTAYQLAVVVDDAHQGVTHVVRGVDLLVSTPRQILLQRALGLTTPAYTHHPVILTAGGRKLSKQTGARAVDPSDPVPQLHAALSFMGQTPPPGLARASLDTLWGWAAQHYDPAAVAEAGSAPSVAPQ